MSAARTRLLRTAAAIFYAEGIHGVGVDRIVAEAQVTRATFYRHFPGKEDLVVAYLEAADAQVRAGIAAATGPAVSPGDAVRLLTEAIGDDLCRPGFRGCAFINAVAEYPDPDSVIHRAVLVHRAWLEATLVAVLADAGHPEPELAGRHVLMLRDGAVVAGYLGDATRARDAFLAGVGLVVRPVNPAGPAER